MIRGAVSFDRHTVVEVIITLPSTGTHMGGSLTGRARVVRTLMSRRTRELAFAIAFDEFRLGRRDPIFDIV